MVKKGKVPKLEQLQDVIGSRGEKIIELRLTAYEDFGNPLFQLAFLGEKWPTIDFYVELNAVRDKRPYFFGQAKSTSGELDTTSLRVTTKKEDIERLLRIPGPTYILGVHEPSQRVFVRSVHAGIPVKAITRIPLSYELNSRNLQKLHVEVSEFWRINNHKPTASEFA